MGQSQSLKMKELIPELKRIVGDDYVLDDEADLLVYEYDLDKSSIGWNECFGAEPSL